MAPQAKSPLRGRNAPKNQPPATGSPPDARTVWRSWLLVPESGPRHTVRPLLTGLYGFPWYSTKVDAKCTQRDRAHGYLASGAFTLDRHHEVIPDPYCTCGIYAGRDELALPRPHPVRGVPFVTGFVSLEGRVLATPDGYRAQQASIIGPLTITPGRPPPSVAVAHRFGIDLVANRVITSAAGYRTLWRRRAAAGLGMWLGTMADQLADRYGVPVLASSPGTRPNRPKG